MVQPLSASLQFPPVSEATEDGLLAYGGDLSAERLLLAYQSGIFPWYEDGQPILWWSPDPRMVLFVNDFKVSKSLQKTIRRAHFSVTFNQNFSEVIRQCATIQRPEQQGTWITSQMQDAYIKLHQQGHAVSFEVWQDEELVGGGYGIDLPERGIYCGESMFSLKSDASKAGLYYLVQRYKKLGYKLLDCQIYTSHLASLGACEIPRKEFIKLLNL